MPIMLKKYLAFCIILLVLLLPVTTFKAAAEERESVNEEENWSFVLYNNYSGMPFSEANVLQQTRD